MSEASMKVESKHHERRSNRQDQLRRWAKRLAPERDKWIERNSFYYDDDRRYMKFLIPEGLRVLELGCGTGHLLNSLAPSYGVGVDISPEMIETARRNHPNLSFVVGNMEDPETLASLDGPFDIIVLSDAIGYLEDCQQTFGLLQSLCHHETRLVISYFSQTWRPALKLAEMIGQKMPQPAQNWLAPGDIEHLLKLQDFEPIRREWRLLVPKRLLGLGPLLNRYVGTLPGVRRLSLRNYVVARSIHNEGLDNPSATVVIPCRNEAGNIEPAIQRLPRFCDDLEVIFVEGHSKDHTVEEIHRVIAAYPDRDIKITQQDGKGKADAVRKGFDMAGGDILIILDADLTVAPEDMGKFYDVIASGKGDYVQGTRLVYPLEPGAMRPLNFAANHTFARLFSWLLNQRITDTLCGTKVLSASHYAALKKGREYFGDFDPFGDFDLIFGAAKLNLKIVELPVRYADRSYGSTQISRFKDGVLLARMVMFAFRKLKAI
jgi:2-polyprenyl-3-methyl-5-hydroxy-6-metoxy-1,4-benzoquinol methylase